MEGALGFLLCVERRWLRITSDTRGADRRSCSWPGLGYQDWPGSTVQSRGSPGSCQLSAETVYSSHYGLSRAVRISGTLASVSDFGKERVGSWEEQGRAVLSVCTAELPFRDLGMKVGLFRHSCTSAPRPQASRFYTTLGQG